MATRADQACTSTIGGQAACDVSTPGSGDHAICCASETNPGGYFHVTG